MQYVREDELREAIRHAISNEKKHAINEQVRSYTINISGKQFWDALIQPWIDVLKIAKLEAQKTLNNLITLFRVMTSFNRQKIQNLMDNHRDRARSLDDKTRALLDAMPVSTDMAVMGFLLNPGAYVAMNTSIPGVTRDVADFFAESGFGDLLPSEIESPDRNSVSRARKREQSGLIAKAYRGLNSLFMAGYNPSGSIILEQDETEEVEEVLPMEERDYSGVQISEEAFNLIIDAGGGLPGVKEAQEGYIDDAESFLADVTTAKQLTDLLGTISQVQDLDQYMGVLDQISQISPETGTATRAQMEQALEADVKSIAATEGAEEEAAKMVLKRAGNSEPTEEELAEVKPEQKESEIRSIAFGNILGQLRVSASEAANGIYDTHKEAYDLLYPQDVDAAVKKIIDDSEYGKLLNSAGSLLDDMEGSVNSLGA